MISENPNVFIFLGSGRAGCSFRLFPRSLSSSGDMSAGQTLWSGVDIPGHRHAPSRRSQGHHDRHGANLGLGFYKLPILGTEALGSSRELWEALSGSVLALGLNSSLSFKSVYCCLMLSFEASRLQNDRQGLGSWWPVLSAHCLSCHRTTVKGVMCSWF